MKVIKLFSDILVVDGFQRSLIQDYNRKKTFFIPLELSDLIKRYDGKISINQINKLKKHKQKNIYIEYYEFLKENDIIFIVEDSLQNLFPKISKKYELPFNIDCLTILLSNINYTIIYKAFEKGLFNTIACFSITCCDEVHLKDIHALIDIISRSEARYVKITIQKDRHLTYKNSLLLIEYIDISIKYNFFQEIVYQIKYPKFSNIFALYIESLYYNPYFHKQIFIDYDGAIKNTPETEDVGFNIKFINKESTFEKIVNNSSLKRYDKITKDKIEICKVCEMRYMCINNKVPQKKGQYWYYQTSCIYNPFICKWADDENFVPIEECGYFDKSFRFVPDYEKIDLLNKTIWGDKE
ncbi:MAG: hypothetical protein J5606_03985 [Bacteroidales bacterium]|nr:hypothetical protein [Bacteroidales bacterium]